MRISSVCWDWNSKHSTEIESHLLNYKSSFNTNIEINWQTFEVKRALNTCDIVQMGERGGVQIPPFIISYSRYRIQFKVTLMKLHEMLPTSPTSRYDWCKFYSPKTIFVNVSKSEKQVKYLFSLVSSLVKRTPFRKFQMNHHNN